MNDVQLVEITPELAHEWLGFNTHNRNIRQRIVTAYAADMTGGDWQWNGESIKFAEDGTLLDGQHRLAADAAEVSHRKKSTDGHRSPPPAPRWTPTRFRIRFCVHRRAGGGDLSPSVVMIEK